MRAYGQCRIEMPDLVGDMAGGDTGPLRWPVEFMDGSQKEFGPDLNYFDRLGGRTMRKVAKNYQSQSATSTDASGDAGEGRR